jgi:DNA polymerase I-like protein with 3'-5' exonuclease and polymerase domains
MQKLCDSHKVIAQNGSFDAYWSRLKDWLSVRVWFDILLAHHALYPQLPHNLAFLTAQYTTHPFYKDEGKAWKEGGDLDRYWKYNCKDAAITYAVYEKLSKELKQEGLEDFYFGHVMRAQPHLVSATVHGVAVDLSMKTRLTELITEDVAKLESNFHRIVTELTEESDYRPNPLSPDQLKALFFDKLGLKGRGYSTDEDNRNLMLKDPATSPLAKEMLVALQRYKEEAKFLGTYAQSRVSSDGRYRCEYKQYGVANAPGRLSSAKLLTGEGGNMQNIPVRARGMYVADPGCVFVYFDLSQAEAQVVSFRADIAKWREQYAQAKRDGVYDSHRALASEMFKVPYDNVPTEDWDADGKPTIRYTAKRCRHGLNYRMERFRLSQVTGLPYHVASRAFALYHSITPELRRWWEQEEAEFKKTRTMYNALGRRFKVVQRLDEAVLGSIIAFYPQSTIGDKITQVWYQCEEDDEWPDDARIAIDVHDNLVGIATERTAKTALKIMKKYAESPIWIQDAWRRRKHEPLSIPAELKMSYPTVWDESKRDFVEDKKGLHRWSTMRKVKL